MRDTIISSLVSTTYQVQQRVPGFRRYEIKDHLGNVRTVISDIKNPYPLNSTPTGSIANWTYLADVRNISNMYPYGKSYPAAATYSADDDYRYGFNGMEKEKSFDSEGDVADFGARIFDANYPVFLSRDPLENEFPTLSPYQFASNNPVYLIDLDGKEGIQYLEKTVYPSGEVTVKRVVEADIHVAVDDAWFSFDPHYEYDDVQKVKDHLKNEFNTDIYYDEDGNQIEFRFNVYMFDVDDISPKEKAKNLMTVDLVESNEVLFKNIDGIAYLNTIPGAVIQKQSISSSGKGGNLQGQTNNNLITIGKGINDESHTTAHEVVHFFFIKNPNNPTTTEEHQERNGGILQYKNLKTGKEIEPLNQKDVDEIIKFVPKGEDKTIVK